MSPLSWNTFLSSYPHSPVRCTLGSNLTLVTSHSKADIIPERVRVTLSQKYCSASILYTYHCAVDSQITSYSQPAYISRHRYSRYDYSFKHKEILFQWTITIYNFFRGCICSYNHNQCIIRWAFTANPPGNLSIILRASTMWVLTLGARSSKDTIPFQPQTSRLFKRRYAVRNLNQNPNISTGNCNRVSQKITRITAPPPTTQYKTRKPNAIPRKRLR